MGTNDRGDPHELRGIKDLHIYPLTNFAGDPYGMQEFPRLLHIVKPDLVFTLNDIWVWTGDEKHPGMDHWMYRQMKEHRPYLPWVGYFAVDARPWEQRWVDSINQMTYAVSMSTYGYKVLSETANVDLSKVVMIPHGACVDKFFPVSIEKRKEIRSRLGINRDEAFLVGCVSRNQPRKNIPRLIQVFKCFSDGYHKCKGCNHPQALDLPHKDCELCGSTEWHPDIPGVGSENTALYLHMNLMDMRGFRLPAILNDNRVRNVIYRPDHNVAMGVPIEELNLLYNAMDVMALPSYCGGFELPCFPKGRKQTTINGVKNIEDISINDRVLTHTGSFKKVVKRYETPYNGKLVSIKFGSNKNKNRATQLTPNHPIALIKFKNPNSKRNREKVDYKLLNWYPAEQAKVGDWVALPKVKRNESQTKTIKLSDFCGKMDYVFRNGLISLKNSNNPKINLTQDYANKAGVNYHQAYRLLAGAGSNLSQIAIAQDWKKEVDWEFIKRLWINNDIKVDHNTSELIGYYLSEGSVSKNVVEFSFHSEETNYHNRVKKLMKDIFGIECLERKLKNKKVIVLTFSSKIVSKFFENFGSGAHNKHIPEELFEHVVPEAIIKGYLRGDGSFARSNLVSYSTASKKLAYQISVLLSSCGFLADVKESIRRRVYKGRNCLSVHYCASINSNEKYLQLYKICEPKENVSIINKRKAGYHYLEDDKFFYFKIVDINMLDYNENVYNFEIEEDHTYVVDQMLSHNCIESQAAGTPVICTRSTAMTEHVENGKGFPVIPDTYVALEDAVQKPKHVIGFQGLIDILTKLYHDKDLRLSVIPKALAYAHERNWDNSASAFDDLFQKALKSRIVISDLVGGKEKAEQKKILIINSSKDPGNLLCMTPLFRQMKKEHKDLHLMVAGDVGSMSIIDNNKNVDEFLDSSKLWFDPENPIQNFLVKEMSNFMIDFTRTSAKFSDLTCEKVWLTQFKMDMNDDKLDLFLSNEDRDFAKKVLPDTDKFRVAICVDSSHPTVAVPFEKWSELIQLLSRINTVEAAVFNSNNVTIKDTYKNIIKVDHDKSFRKMAAALERCDMVVTLDNAFIQICKVLNKKMLIVQGPRNVASKLQGYTNYETIQKDKMFSECMPCWAFVGSPCMVTGNENAACMININSTEIFGRIMKIMNEHKEAKNREKEAVSIA